MALTPLSFDAAICEFSYTRGTGTYLLAGAFSGCLPFSDAPEFVGGATGTYHVTDGSIGVASNMEIATGVYNSGAKTLTRASIIASTNGGAPVNWNGSTRLTIRALVSGSPGAPVAVVCPTPPMDGQVLIWSAIDNAYCPADFCSLVAACLIPSPLNAGAVSFGGDAFGWLFPAMSDSSSFSMSAWLYVAAAQFASAPSPQGGMFGAASAYLFNDPGDSGQENFTGLGGFRSWRGVGGTDTPINDIVSITRANPAVMTFTNPHGIDADTYLTGWSPGFANPDWATAFTFPGADHITAVTSTTVTVAVDTSAIASAWNTPTGSNTSGHGGVRFYIFNAMELQVGDSGSNSASWTWGKALPPGQWVNMLLSIDTNHAAGAKVATLYFGDTLVPLSALVDTSAAFSMFFSEADVAEGDSWKIGGNYFTSGVTVYMAEMWGAAGQLVDFTNSANRAKFHDGMGNPISLGADGSLPTGTKPTLYLHQPTTPRVAPVKWIDPTAVWVTPAAGFAGTPAYMETASTPLANGITTSSLLTFSFWCDQHTVGNVLDLGNGASNGNINLYDGVCAVDIIDNSSNHFTFTFPYSVGTGGNIRVGVDAGHIIGSKIVNAYVNGSSASVTVTADDVDNLVMDWTGTIDFFLTSQGYIGDLWVAPNYFVDPGPYFYSAGAPGTLPPTTPSMYFHISGADSADAFSTNHGNGGTFTILNGTGAGHFSLLSPTEFFDNATGNGSLKMAQFSTTLHLAPVSFP